MNKLKMLLACMCLFFIFSCKKETKPVQTFVKVFGDEGIDNANSAILANDGNYLVLSDHDPGNGSKPEVQLQKISQKGELIWKRTYTSDYRINANKVVQHNNGDIFIGGVKHFTEDETEPWFILTDIEGHEKRSFTIDILRSGRVEDVITVPEGYLVSASNHIRLNTAYPSGKFLLLDFSGNLNRQIMLSKSLNNYITNTVTSMTLMPDGTVMANGLFARNFWFGSNSINGTFTTPDIMLLNIDYRKSQYLVFSKAIKAEHEQKLYDIEPLDNGQYLLGGITMKPYNGNYNIYMLKVDNAGSMVSDTTYVSYRRSQIKNITNTTGNKFYVVIDSKSDIVESDDILHVKRYHYSGEEDMSFKFTLPRSWGCSVIPLEDGGCIIVTNTGLTGKGKNKADILVYKVDKNGIF